MRERGLAFAKIASTYTTSWWLTRSVPKFCQFRHCWHYFASRYDGSRRAEVRQVTRLGKQKAIILSCNCVADEGEEGKRRIDRHRQICLSESIWSSPTISEIQWPRPGLPRHFIKHERARGGADISKSHHSSMQHPSVESVSLAQRFQHKIILQTQIVREQRIWGTLLNPTLILHAVI